MEPFIRVFSGTGETKGDYALGLPWPMAVLPDTEELAVGSLQSNHIHIYDIHTGEFKRKFGGNRMCVQGLCGLAADSHGNLIVFEINTNRLQVYSSVDGASRSIPTDSRCTAQLMVRTFVRGTILG
jgi:hypothetical protein